MTGFERIQAWSDQELSRRFLQAHEWKMANVRRVTELAELIVEIVYEDLRTEMRRRQLPIPCPACGSRAVGVIGSATALYQCRQCKHQFE
jgi:DNA-directed RNA polymerase subunit RPC12/RpoP